jgi:beta-xylosidase
MAVAILKAVPRALRHIVRAALAALALCLLPLTGAAPAWALSYRNPLRDPRTGAPLSCPDPSVTYAPAPGTGYDLVCTSGMNRDAFPVYTSQDLVHWQRQGLVFPHGHQPWWAVPSTGRSKGGRFWAPELDRIGDRWVIYFAAEYNAAKLRLRIPGQGRVAPGRMVVGYGTAASLAGPWRTGILHYAGELNGVNAAANEREVVRPAIDPSVVEDPTTGQLYMFWADEPDQIWAGKLTPDGTSLEPPLRRVLRVSEPFECDPRDHHCTVEAPEPFYANGGFYLFYSGASTWDSSYAVGVASSPGPFGPFVKLGHAIIRQGGGFYSTGHTSEPVIGPDGNTYILYHARTKPGVQRPAATRYLMLGLLTWAGGWPAVSGP